MGPPVSAGYRARALLQRADVMLRREERASLNIHSTKTSNFPSTCNFPCMHVSSVFQVGPSTSTFVTPVHYVRGFSYAHTHVFVCLLSSIVLECSINVLPHEGCRCLGQSGQVNWSGGDLFFGVWLNY